MLDINYIRDNPELVQKAAEVKGVEVSISELIEFDTKRRELIEQVEKLRSERNELSQGHNNEKPSQEIIEKGKELKDQLASLERDLGEASAKFYELLRKVPNIPSEDTPISESDENNKVIKTSGDKKTFDFEVKDHQTLGEEKGWIDKEKAARVSGARFAYLMGDLVKLQFALLQYGMEVVTNEDTLKKIIAENNLDVSSKPYKEMLPPVIMRTDAYEKTARLKPGDVTYKLEQDDQWLTGSAEHTMCSYYLGETLQAEELPIRFVGYSTSFRREAGTYGKDTRGILRMHQFDKLEMESFAAPNRGMQEHELQIAIQEYIMQQLGLPYQVVVKGTGDMGDPNHRGVDIETWMPSQENYRETHSADYMTDYQARGMNTKVALGNGEREYLHTVDATVFAMGRTMIAILENYQTAEGDVMVPEVLRPFMQNKEKI